MRIIQGNVRNATTGKTSALFFYCAAISKNNSANFGKYWFKSAGLYSIAVKAFSMMPL
jgi:hypothetical protein